MVVRGNSKNHYDLGITWHDGQRQVFFRKVLDGKVSGPVQYKTIGSGDIILLMNASPSSYQFFYRPSHGWARSLGTALTRDVSSEKIGGFTGAYLGMYATGNRQTNSVPADFDRFEYDGDHKP